MEAGRPQEALPLLQETLAVIEATPLPAERIDLLAGWAETLLGRCLTLVGSYAEAEPLALGGFEKLRRAYGEGHIRTRTAIRCLVQLYEAWGRGDDSAAWRARLPN